MVRKKSRYNQKLLLPLLGLVVLLLIAGGVLAWRHHSKPTATATSNSGVGTRPTNSVDYSPAKPGDNTATNQSKGSTPAAYTPPSGGSTSPSTSITITEAHGSNGSIEVAALVQGVTSGICIFNFSNTDGGPVKNSFSESVQLATNYYSCPRHTVSGLSSGNWYISATLTSGGQSAGTKWAANPVRL